MRPTRFTRPSTTVRSVRPETHELTSVIQPVPFTAPSIMRRSNVQNARPLANVPETTVALYSSST